MPDDNLIENGELVLEGTLVPDEYLIYYDGGAFSAGMVRTALSDMDGDIVVRVNSPGGDPRGGEAVRVMLAEHDGDVTVKVVGEASSAASLMIMSATRIEMSAGSVMMIHDPSALTWGTAEDHEKTMTSLNVLADTYAGVYAAKSGRKRKEMRQVMKDELWMGPDEAMAEGFADGLIAADAGQGDGDAAPQMKSNQKDPRVDPFKTARAHHAAAMDRMADAANVIANLPSSVTAGQPAAESGQPMALMAAKEGDMPKNSTAAVTNGQPNENVTPSQAQGDAPVQTTTAPQMNEEQVRDQERARVRGITMAARPHVTSGALTEGFVDDLIDRGVSVDMASTEILGALAGTQPDINMVSPARATRVGREDVETRRDGMTMALAAHFSGTSGPVDDMARPYMQMSIPEMAAVSVGRTPSGYGSYAAREDLIMSAMHTTSDFPAILGNAVNRVLAQQYELVDRTFTEVSAEMTFNDFRAHDVVRADEFPALQKINEAGEIQFGSMGDSKEVLTLASYATGLGISRQALVNDDLGAIQDVLASAAAIVPEFEEDIFWSVFLNNMALSDSIAMFHASHGNLAGSGTAITTAAVSAGRKALRTMKTADGKRTIKQNAPSILLVGPDKETEAEQFLRDVAATKAVDVNIFSGKLRPVVTEAIKDNTWYLLVDPAKRTHNMKHGYLRDRPAPRVRVDEPFAVQGMRMTLEHDFGVGGVNYRGGYKNPGA